MILTIVTLKLKAQYQCRIKIVQILRRFAVKVTPFSVAICNSMSHKISVYLHHITRLYNKSLYFAISIKFKSVSEILIATPCYFRKYSNICKITFYFLNYDVLLRIQRSEIVSEMQG